MDITPYVESLRHDLAAAAEAGGPEAKRRRRAARPRPRPGRPARPDGRAVAGRRRDHRELPAGSVDVRLRGREPEFVVDVPTVPMPAARPHPPPPDARRRAEDAEEAEDGAVARITLRIPESVKYKAEELAAKGGHSLNSWIVNVVRAATRERAASTSTSTSPASRSSTARASRPGAAAAPSA